MGPRRIITGTYVARDYMKSTRHELVDLILVVRTHTDDQSGLAEGPRLVEEPGLRS